MKILVTGGAGYIGSFMVRLLIDSGHQVIVLDNLARGHKEVVDNRAKLVIGDINNDADLIPLFTKDKIDAVMHFAAYISVEESEKNPDLYYQNNVVGSENLFSTAIEMGGVTKFIFSSSAAVYGNPQEIPIKENHPKNPTSEYGKNKLAMENILISLRDKNPNISFVALRYFNAAGASLEGIFGEDHNLETHIIPLAIRAAIFDREFNLYGTDYNTQDGTCVRDYIHVLDLTRAHTLALQKIEDNPGGYFYNVGTGIGYSNKQVINQVEIAAGKKIKIIEQTRRLGDADQLIADPSKINNDLNFKPQYSDLETIVESAWKWHSKRSKT